MASLFDHAASPYARNERSGEKGNKKDLQCIHLSRRSQYLRRRGTYDSGIFSHCNEYKVNEKEWRS